MKGIARRTGRPSHRELLEHEGPHGLVLRALAHRTRRQILLLLASGPLAVRDVAEHFDVSRPMVSKHLRVLRQAGLVEATAAGRERHYRLAAGGAAEMALRLATADEGHHEQVRRLRERLERDA